MKRILFRTRNLIYILLFGAVVYSCNQNKITINDTDGIFAKTNAPVSVKLELNKNQRIAAKEGRLGFLDLSAKNKTIIPVQLEISDNSAETKVVLFMPEGEPGVRNFKLIEAKSPAITEIKAKLDKKTRQIIVEENDKKVLQYNYQTVFEKDVIRLGNTQNTHSSTSQVKGIYFDEYLKAHPEVSKDTFVTSLIYAVPRSDYIHPLFGLNGEMLTLDWPDGGHQHHRGIFWAWPQIEYGTERGDIYALQRVFARPTGNIKYYSGPVYAEIRAENLWIWNDSEPIANEQVVIRVYHSTPENRVIDLTIKLLALKDSVTIATRFTNSYGGLNLRLQSPESQDISYFTDTTNLKPLRAWSDFNGIFKGSNSTSGLMVLQHQSNPEYPGEWRDYPNLGWVQPTFPTPNTKYPLNKNEPLVLRYRLIIHNGGKPSKDISKKNWDAYHSLEAPFKQLINEH